MTTGLIGGHIIANIGSYNRDNNQAALVSLGGKFAVFVNDLHAVSMWVAAGGIAAHRINDGQYADDDADKNIPNPEAYADRICNELDVATAHLPPALKWNAVAHGGNELFTQLPLRTDAWLARFIDRCTARGYRVVVGNWAYKNRIPHLPLTIAALRRNRGWMGFHEGTYRDKPLAQDAFADGGIGGFIEWHRATGLPVWITEFAGSYDPHYGWMTLYNGDAAMWAAQIEWAMTHVYQPYNVPISIFTEEWDKGSGWTWNTPELIAHLNRLNRRFIYMVNPTNPSPIEPTPDSDEYQDHQLMLVDDTVLNVANVRAGTNTKAAIITTIKEDDVVLASRETPPINGYRWRNIRQINGQPLRDAAGLPYTDGWVAHVATLIPVPPPVEEDRVIVLLDVPFVSQLGVTANLRENDCLNADAQMLAQMFLNRAGLHMPLLERVNNLIHVSPLADNDGVVDVDEARTFMNLLGVPNAWSDQLKPPLIMSELDAGRPVLLLGNYAHLNPGQKKFGHWFIVVGYSEQGFIIHDPYLMGANVRITKAQLQAAQTDLEWWRGGTFAGKPYQGFIIG